MKVSVDLTWVEFYMAFATKLLVYKQDRVRLIEKLQHVYQSIGAKFPKLEIDDAVTDIDPFTIFGMFNKGLTNANRISILEGIASEFGIASQIPDGFDGIPLVNNMKAAFFSYVGERGEQDINNLWDLFESAIQLANEDSTSNRENFSTYFDLVTYQLGIRWNLTMGLYWIRPYRFINLDSRNRWFISNPSNLPVEVVNSLHGLDKVPTAQEYLSTCDTLKTVLQSNKYPYHNFPELSYFAWEQSTANKEIDTVRYWIYSPGDNASKWEQFYNAGIIGISWGEIGDLRSYQSKEAIKQQMKATIDPSLSFKNAAHATWQFANEMKPGDIIFVKKGLYSLVGRGVVTSDYDFDLSCPDSYKNIRNVEWTHKGEWIHPGQAVLKTLTDITQYTEYVDKLNKLFEDGETVKLDPVYPPYNEEDFLNEVYMSEGDYRTLVYLLKHKKNVILQGAPGVGKTFASKRIAYSIMGLKDKERVMMVQFHQSYSYEDFMMGFRPSEQGFELKRGAFYTFCKNAEIDSDNDYFFIIDEINRGNLSKIFGELFMLIESDKRGVELQLLYSDEKFSVPANVHIVGMMNTADRSLAMLDYALRRRFAFYDLKPGFESEGFRNYRDRLDNLKFNRLINTVENLNAAITADDSLGEGFCIGHSYFCGLSEVDDRVLSNIVAYELIPLLKEYWFDEPTKVKDWSSRLRGAIQ